MDAAPDRQHQQRGGSVHRVARAQLLRARLQEVVFLRLRDALGAAQDREDGAHRHVHVDVGGAIQRVEQQEIFPLGIAMRDCIGVVHFLRGHGGKVAAPFVGLEQDLVGDHVELLLDLALHVLGLGAAEHAREPALADGDGDGLAGPCDHLDEKPEVGGDELLGALFLDQELGERDASHGFCLAGWGVDGIRRLCSRGRRRATVVSRRRAGITDSAVPGRAARGTGS